MDDADDQRDEVEALSSIFAEEFLCADLESPPFSFEITVNVALDESVQLEVVPPAAASPPGAELLPGAPPPPPLRAMVSHLPSLTLRVRLPANYPSEAAPGFQIASSWHATPALTMLADRLADIAASEYAHEPVVFAWVEALRDGALDAARSRFGVCVYPSDERWQSSASGASASGGASAGSVATPTSPSDSRVETLWKSRGFAGAAGAGGEEWLHAMLAFDARTKSAEWRANEHECEVCQEDVRGDRFTRLRCGHAFCTACTTEAARVHIAEGSVERILCFDCSAPLTPQQLTELPLSKEEIERCERLRLARSLDSMTDISYCPRCETACIESSEGDMAQCSACSYAFCTLCLGSYHPAARCMSNEAKLRLLRKRKEKAEEARGSRAALDALVAEERRIVENMRSVEAIERTTMACPCCGTPTLKSEGCNKMTCATCGAYFCYRCGADISEESYTHFSSAACSLFDAEAIAQWERQMAAQQGVPLQHVVNERLLRGDDAEQWRERMRRCPMCRCNHMKVGNNNHVKCWGCGGGFCFTCGVVLRKGKAMAHFMGKCNQHG